MSERTSYAHGIPSWVDLSSPDPQASAAFYGALFGWEHVPPENPEVTGGYGMFMLRGKLVAGVGPLMSEDQPVVWSTYVAVDDADEVAAKARDAGGQVFIEPMDVLDAGRMAFLVDPTGGFIGLWQAGRHHGAELVNEPGALAWNELRTRDVDAAVAFYGDVLGWTTQPWEGDYKTWVNDGDIVGGVTALGDEQPPEVPSHWSVAFIAQDVDASTAMTKELGGGVLVEPFDAPRVGRVAVLTDPHGAMFSIVSPPASQTDAAA